MLLFVPRSLCALKRVAAKSEHARYAATQGIRIAVAPGLYRAEATDGRRALIVQGLVPTEEPPWPGFKEAPDDAFEAIILPKDLERGCKVGEDFLQTRFGLLGIATIAHGVCLGLGDDVVTARTVEGRFPRVDQVIPKKRPLFSFRVDPRLLGETLLAMADLLPDESRAVQCFYYGDGEPIGFCARNIETGMMIDALVVPLVAAKPDAKDDKAAQGKPTEGKPEEPKSNGQRRKKDEPAPDAKGQAEDSASKVQGPTAPDAKPQEANGQAVQPGKKCKKAS